MKTDVGNLNLLFLKYHGKLMGLSNMDNNITASRIGKIFRDQIRNDNTVNNAFMLVNSDKLGVDLNIAEGRTGNIEADPRQPNHLACVGKLFYSDPDSHA